MSSDTFVRLGLRRGEWDLSQGCENPFPVVLHSRTTGMFKYLNSLGLKRPAGMELILHTRCRHCGWCRRRKSYEWATRAESEIEMSQRTWFGTLTLNPDNHVRMEWLAASKIGNFAQASSRKKFELTSLQIGREVTLFFKRLRKNNPGSKIRYLCVTEIHDSEKTSPEMRGRPHVHLLMHEYPGLPITKRALEQEWTLGFQKWKLCDKGAGWYLAKYVSKASEVRVRASLGYGADATFSK